MSRRLIAAVAGVSLVCAVAASASVAPLGIKTVVPTSKPGGLLTVRIDLNRAWTSKLLGPSSSTALRVMYDGNADGKADYTGRIVYRGTSLAEDIVGHGNKYEPVPVARPTTASVRFTHPTDILYTGVKPKRQLRIAVQLKTPQRTQRTAWMLVPQPR